jgi:phytanoyl-CoA hydroxylase
MAALTERQIERFRVDGYVCAEAAVTPEQLSALVAALAGWVEEAARRGENFGETIDGRARFDLEPGGDGAPPALRRVNNPVEVSDAYYEVMANSVLTDMVAQLIGPNVKFHHSKINVKLPGTATVVAGHQDFTYTPHTNTDMVAALLMLDDMTLENGCLMAAPGSHRDGIFSLWHDDKFTGAVSDEVRDRYADRMAPITGRAGSVCLMHTLTLHGSAPNRSRGPRGVFIPVYTAADAFPLADSPVASKFQGLVVRGEATRLARVIDCEVELPEVYGETSFFAVQGRSAGE